MLWELLEEKKNEFYMFPDRQDIFVLLFHISPQEGFKLLSTENNRSDTRLADLCPCLTSQIICNW